MMARFQEQHGQYFLGFSYFANLPATCLWNNSKIWVRNKVIIGRIVRSEHLIISLSPRSKISFCYLYENIYFLIHNLLNLLRVAIIIIIMMMMMMMMIIIIIIIIIIITTTTTITLLLFIFLLWPVNFMKIEWMQNGSKTH